MRPWTWDEGEPHMVAGDPETTFDCYYVFDADGNCVAIVPDDPYLGLSVVDNRDLIVRAPDLLETCRTVHGILDGGWERPRSEAEQAVLNALSRVIAPRRQDAEDQIAARQEQPGTGGT